MKTLFWRLQIGTFNRRRWYCLIDFHQRGLKRAALAVAHSILVIIYHLLKNQTTYREKGETFFEERDRQGMEKRLVRQLSGLGYHVELQPIALAG